MTEIDCDVYRFTFLDVLRGESVELSLITIRVPFRYTDDQGNLQIQDAYYILDQSTLKEVAGYLRTKGTPMGVFEYLDECRCGMFTVGGRGPVMTTKIDDILYQATIGGLDSCRDLRGDDANTEWRGRRASAFMAIAYHTSLRHGSKKIKLRDDARDKDGNLYSGQSFMKSMPLYYERYGFSYNEIEKLPNDDRIYEIRKEYATAGYEQGLLEEELEGELASLLLNGTLKMPPESGLSLRQQMRRWMGECRNRGAKMPIGLLREPHVLDLSARLADELDAIAARMEDGTRQMLKRKHDEVNVSALAMGRGSLPALHLLRL